MVAPSFVPSQRPNVLLRCSTDSVHALNDNVHGGDVSWSLPFCCWCSCGSCCAASTGKGEVSVYLSLRNLSCCQSKEHYHHISCPVCLLLSRCLRMTTNDPLASHQSSSVAGPLGIKLSSNVSSDWRLCSAPPPVPLGIPFGYIYIFKLRMNTGKRRRRTER